MATLFFNTTYGLINTLFLLVGYGEVSLPSMFDFSSYPANQEKKHLFTITNTSDRDWKFLKIRTTCGCVQGTLDSSILKSGKITCLNVIVKRNSLEGDFNKAIYVETDNPRQRFLKFSVKGTALPAVTILPEKLRYIGTLDIQKKYTFSFQIAPKIEHVTLGTPKLSRDLRLQHFEFKPEVGWDLCLALKPMQKTEFYQQEIAIPILTPEGWPPIKIILSGQVTEPKKIEQ